jgi:hypothetical protein
MQNPLLGHETELKAAGEVESIWVGAPQPAATASARRGGDTPTRVIARQSPTTVDQEKMARSRTVTTEAATTTAVTTRTVPERLSI